MSRVYIVTDTQHDTDYLVRANSKAQAVRFVARNLGAEVASQDDIISMLGRGAHVLDATADVQPEPLDVD